MIVETTKSCNPLYFELIYPSCVEVIVEAFDLVGIPLSVEVIVVVFEPYPSRER